MDTGPVPTVAGVSAYLGSTADSTRREPGQPKRLDAVRRRRPEDEQAEIAASARSPASPRGKMGRIIDRYV